MERDNKINDGEVDGIFDDVLEVIEDMTKPTVYGSEYDPERDKKVEAATDRLERFVAGERDVYGDRASGARAETKEETQ